MLSSEKKINAVHPLNAGPGFQAVLKQPKSIHYHNESDNDDNESLLLYSTKSLPNEKHNRTFSNECLKGLEALNNLDYIFIKESALITEFFINASNKFEIINSFGEFVYLAADVSPPLTKIFCFGGHPFEICINTLPSSTAYSWNAKGKEILRLSGSSGSCGCGAEVSVTHGKKIIGTIEQEGDCTHPHYFIKDSENVEIFSIQGPPKSTCFSCGFQMVENGSLRFDIISPNEGKNVVGRIGKQWGKLRERSSEEISIISKKSNKLFSNEKNNEEGEKYNCKQNNSACSELWGLKFPSSADSNSKGLLLSAVFLLEYQYYNTSAL